jgi:soluble lytic murein transglycosylase
MFDPCIRPALAPAPAPVLAPPSALQSLVRFFPRLVLLLALLAAPAIAPAQGQAEVDALSRALGRVAAEDWDGAAQAAQGAGELVGDLVAWHRLRAGAGTLGEYEDFLLRRPDWPGLPFLK